MYGLDQDHEMDNNWMSFLSEFVQPLTNADEDDEKSDPEYVAAEKVPLDKEELRPVRVSKKELNELIAELLEDSNLNFDFEPGTSSTSSKRSSTDGSRDKPKRQRVASPSHSKPQSPRISSRMYSQQELLTTPTRFGDAAVSFLHNQLLTPQRPDPPASFFTASATQMSSLTPEPSSFPQITGVYGSALSSTIASPQPPPILVMNAQNQLEIRSSANLINQAFMSNGVVQLPQFQSVIIQVPTIDLLQNRLKLPAMISQPHDAISDPPSPAPLAESVNLTDDKKKKIFRRLKLVDFEHLATEEPPEDKFTDENVPGFTYEQRQIYEQQMRMHAQLLSQHFLQLYASPKWWDKAEPVKKNLVELDEAVNANVSPHTSRHIKNCLEMCNEWETSLQENSERNKKYAEFLYEEHELDERALSTRQKFKGRFSNRLMEHMLSSKAILYPKLLPTVPFRVVTFHKIEPPNSEISLFATGLERFYLEQYKKLNDLNPYKIRQPGLGTLARCIAREYKSFRNQKSLVKLIEAYKVHKQMNPIKYYFIHKKAPSVKHEIEDVDLDNVVAPKELRRGLLPRKWDAYMFSQERVSIVSRLFII